MNSGRPHIDPCTVRRQLKYSRRDLDKVHAISVIHHCGQIYKQQGVQTTRVQPQPRVKGDQVWRSGRNHSRTMHSAVEKDVITDLA